MSAVMVRADLTGAQKAALRWLHNRGGEGVFTNGQVLMAAGELAGVMRATWNALAKVDPPCVEIAARRAKLTDAGKAVALTWRTEAATVESDDDE